MLGPPAGVFFVIEVGSRRARPFPVRTASTGGRHEWRLEFRTPSGHFVEAACRARLLTSTYTTRAGSSARIEHRTSNPTVAGSNPARRAKGTAGRRATDESRKPFRSPEMPEVQTDCQRALLFQPSPSAATAVAASSCRAGIAWLYVSSVVPMLACPRRSETTFGWMPAASAMLA